MCVEDIKLQLLARSVLVPGLPNLLFSLIKSSDNVPGVKTSEVRVSCFPINERHLRHRVFLLVGLRYCLTLSLLVSFTVVIPCFSQE